MAQSLGTQHPAVALKSHYDAVRAMLVVALIAVIGLTVAVVILATDDQQVTGVSHAAPTLSSPQARSGPSESSIAAAIGSGAGPAATGGPNESTVAHAVAGR